MLDMSEGGGEAKAGGGAPAVFISYASQDAPVAAALVEALERHGIACWIAPRNVQAGALYADAIVRAISGAKAFVLVLSKNSIASSHVSKEIERASSKKRPIIALRIDAAPLTPALEYFLSESQWVEAQAGKYGPRIRQADWCDSCACTSPTANLSNCGSGNVRRYRFDGTSQVTSKSACALNRTRRRCGTHRAVSE
jgi:TIR domain